MVAGNRLWLRQASGEISHDPSGALVSFSINGKARRLHFAQGVLDIEKSAGDLWVLRWSSAERKEVVVSILRHAGFADVVRFATAPGEQPVALVASGGRVVVLSQQAIHLWTPDGRVRRVALTGTLRSAILMTAAATARGTAIYIGFDNGEFGAGLQRVDLTSGAVADIESQGDTEASRGLLSADEPVTAVIADSRHDDCVLAAIGLQHIVLMGRIVRVCGGDVTLVAAKPFLVDSRPDASMTEAFYTLAASTDGGYWTSSDTSVYRLAADGAEKAAFKLPPARRASGVYLSRAIPGVIVVWTDLNSAVSARIASSYSPLVAPY